MRKVACLAFEILALVVAIWLLVNHGDGQTTAVWPAGAALIAR